MCENKLHGKNVWRARQVIKEAFDFSTRNTYIYSILFHINPSVVYHTLYAAMKFSSMQCLSLERKDLQSLSLVWLISTLTTEIPILLSNGMIGPVDIYFSLAEGHITYFIYKICQNEIKRLYGCCTVSQWQIVTELRLPSSLTLLPCFCTFDNVSVFPQQYYSGT